VAHGSIERAREGAEQDQREVEEKIYRLKALYDSGAITQSDFEEQKKALLARTQARASEDQNSNRGSIAGGLLGLFSLILPWEVDVFSLSTLNIEVLWLLGGYGVYYDTYSDNFSGNWFSVLGYYKIYEVLFLAAFSLLLAGAVLMLVSATTSRWGGALTLAGFLLVLGDDLWFEHFGLYGIVPLGMIFAVIAAIIGLRTKPRKRVAQGEEKEQSAYDRLLRLKALYDSGAITKEDYDRLKKEILEG